MTVMNLVAPKAAAKHRLVFNKPTSGLTHEKQTVPKIKLRGKTLQLILRRRQKKKRFLASPPRRISEEIPESSVGGSVEVDDGYGGDAGVGQSGGSDVGVRQHVLQLTGNDERNIFGNELSEKIGRRGYAGDGFDLRPPL